MKSRSNTGKTKPLTARNIWNQKQNAEAKTNYKVMANY